MDRVLITGGTGSLGRKLVKHYFKRGWKVRVLSRCEDKQSRLKIKYPGVEFVLGDVRDMETCYDACKGVDLVIHTAALKRIEFGEEFPKEFIDTNLKGTKNMVECASARMSDLVFISTDKACKPINVYGMTKALAEKIVTNAGFNCVRYGNVNNSRGSVIPYWLELRKKGEPLPVTNTDMTRFMISFDEAIKLIETASETMEGAIYVPKLKSVRLMSIVDALGCDFEVVGERPGEKLHEVLINEDEFRGRVIDRGKYYTVVKQRDMRRAKKFEYSSETAERINTKELNKILCL